MKNLALFIVLGLNTFGTAMDFQNIRLSTWKGTETILGEEFIAGNEAVVDYAKSLPHPDSSLSAIRYQCQAKIRRSRQWVNTENPSGSISNQQLDFFTVYELKDCTRES